jgi:hypothetical protein
MADWRDSQGAMKIAIAAVYTFLASEILFGIGTAFTIAALARRNPADPQTIDDIVISETADIAMGFVALAYLIALIFAAFASLRWVYRLNANSHLLSDNVHISPRWNVGWFFVPLANLFKPFEGLAQAWQASQIWRKDPVEDLPYEMRWWWGLWVDYVIINNISFRLEFRAETVGDQLVMGAMNLFTSVIAVPLCLAFVSVIRKLTEAQVSARNFQAFS